MARVYLLQIFDTMRRIVDPKKLGRGMGGSGRGVSSRGSGNFQQLRPPAKGRISRRISDLEKATLLAIANSIKEHIQKYVLEGRMAVPNTDATKMWKSHFGLSSLSAVSTGWLINTALKVLPFGRYNYRIGFKSTDINKDKLGKAWSAADIAAHMESGWQWTVSEKQKRFYAFWAMEGAFPKSFFRIPVGTLMSHPPFPFFTEGIKDWRQSGKMEGYEQALSAALAKEVNDSLCGVG